jgi:predicted DNA repair protein MutK
MAGSSLLTLIDDIASLLDDIALLTKVSAKKTASVLGDDLALNAQQVTGVSADRELPVVWAVAKGSLRNKAILVPAALAVSAVAGWAVTPLLMAGGLFLCFEGAEKLAHRWLHPTSATTTPSGPQVRALADPTPDPAEFERARIRGAIRTDLILSAEIIAITLGTVAEASFGTRVAVLTGVAVLMTVGVYGLVAAIVKLDDFGLLLSRHPGTGLRARSLRRLGAGVLQTAPWLMKGLSVAGTAAMFLVGGGILAHGIPWLHSLPEAITGIPGIIVPVLIDAVTGLTAGALALGVVGLVGKLRGR